MTSKERDWLIVALAATAGSTDAWSYLGLGHVFIANMTGNTILLGASLSQGHMAAAARPAVGIVSYLCGVFIGTTLLDADFARPARLESATELWPVHVRRVIGVESLLLVICAVVWAFHGRDDAMLRHALVSVAAFALGMQSAAMQTLKLPGVVTTYITGTWTSLVAGLSRLVTGKAGEPDSGAKMRIQASVLTAYFMAAGVSGLLFRRWSLGLGILPASAALAVTLYGTWSRLAGGAKRPPKVI